MNVVVLETVLLVKMVGSINQGNNLSLYSRAFIKSKRKFIPMNFSSWLPFAELGSCWFPCSLVFGVSSGVVVSEILIQSTYLLFE